MLGVGRLHLVGGRGFVDDLDRLRRLPDRALHLFVVEVADQDDPIPVPREPAGLGMDLGDQRARGVDHA